MKINHQLLIFAIIITQSAYSQTNTIKVNNEQNEDKSVTFSYSKKEFGTFFLSVWFSNQDNFFSSGFKGNISSHRGRLFTIKPIDENKAISYAYKSWYIRGKSNPKVNHDFVYLLPLGKNKSVELRNLVNLGEKYAGSSRPKNWTAYQLNTEIGDTVFAARKGIVVEITDQFEYDTAHQISYQSEVNSTIIEHADGTLAKYSGLKKDCFFVKQGQTVFPRTPLATIAQYDKDKTGQLRFSVYYLDNTKPDEEKNRRYKDKIQYYAYVEPIFLTEKGDVKLENLGSYKVIVDENIVSKEFTRREKKKFIGNK